MMIGIATWLLWGVELNLLTVPGGAYVILDGKPLGTSVGNPGVLTIPHLSRGSHRLDVTASGFEEWTQEVSLGWGESTHPLKVTLSLPTFPVTVLSKPPGAKVQIDGQEVGATDSSSRLLAKVPQGQHTLTVTAQGYPPFSSPMFVLGPITVPVDLVMLAAQARQETAVHITNAQSFFQQRQYQAAVSECEAALRLDPSNHEATELESQIKQTMSVLGIQ